MLNKHKKGQVFFHEQLYKMCSGYGNNGMIKTILRINEGIDCGSVRLPLAKLIESDLPIAKECAEMIRAATSKYYY